MTTITLAVDPIRFENAVHQSMHVLAGLLKAGVPAIGVLGVTGVEYGTLSLGAPDLATGEVTYSWTDN